MARRFVQSCGRDGLSLSIRRNTAYNLLGSLIPLAVSLVTIPIYLGLIGEARYGVLAIAWLLLGYFGLFDLGLGRATAQRIAALHDGTASERAQTFWTALTLNIGLGILGGLLIWPLASYFFGNVFQVDEALRPEMQAAVPWLILAVPMATLSGVLSGALQGRERFLELNLISVSGTVCLVSSAATHDGDAFRRRSGRATTRRPIRPPVHAADAVRPLPTPRHPRTGNHL